MIYVLDKYDRLVTVLCTDKMLSEGIQVLAARTKVINGGASTIEVTIDSSHEDAGLISDTEHQSLLFRDSEGEWQQFYISEIEDDHSFSLTKTMFGESVSQELYNRFCTEDVTVADLDGKPQTLINYCLAPSRWVLGECDLTGETIHLLETKNKSVSELLDECASLYGAGYRFRIEVDAESNIKVLNRYVDFKKSLYRFKGKVFSVGKDIVSLKRSVDASNVKTAIIPVMADLGGEEAAPISISDVEWSVANGDPVDKPKGQNWVGDPTTLQLWGYYDAKLGAMNHRFMKAEFNEAATPEELLSQAWKVLKMNSTPKVSYEINVIDLYRLTMDEDLLHEHVVLGERVRVVDKDFHPALIVDANIVEMEKDLLDPTNDLVVIGNPRNSIADSFNKIETQLSDRLTFQDLAQTITQLKENTYYVENNREIKAGTDTKDLLYVNMVLSDITEVMVHFSACVYADSPCIATFKLINNGATFPFTPMQTMTVGYNIVSFNIVFLTMSTDTGTVSVAPKQANMVIKGSKVLISDKLPPFTRGEHYEVIDTPDIVIPAFGSSMTVKNVVKPPQLHVMNLSEKYVVNEIETSIIKIMGE